MKQKKDCKKGIPSFTSRLKEYCKAKGLKISSKRIEVIVFLENTGKDIEADELLLVMRNARVKISAPYIYQCLGWLVELDLVLKKPGIDKRQRYFVNPDLLV